MRATTLAAPDFGFARDRKTTNGSRTGETASKQGCDWEDTLLRIYAVLRKAPDRYKHVATAQRPIGCRLNERDALRAFECELPLVAVRDAGANAMPLTAMLSAAAAASLVLQPMPPRSSEWYDFGIDAANNRIAIGLGSLLVAGTTMYLRMRLTAPQKVEDDASSAIFDLAIECSSRRFAIISTSAYRRDGSQLSAEQPPLSMAPIAAGSQTDRIRAAVCF